MESKEKTMLERPSKKPSFDTQWVVDRLKKGGWTAEQARALCDVLREVLRGLATTAALETAVGSLRTEMLVKFETLRSEMDARMRVLEGKMDNLRWIMATGFVLLGLLIVFKDVL